MKLKIYAPNIHTGGGLVLLQEMLNDWPDNSILVAWFDIRAKSQLNLPLNSNVIWVKPSILSRLVAEVQIFRSCSKTDHILLMHGLPPLLPLRSKVFLFMQNRLLIDRVDLSSFPVKIRLRLFFERAIARMFRSKIDIYWVQTPSMAALLNDWSQPHGAKINVIPFATLPTKRIFSYKKKWDFVYVADGVSHKNHRTLIESWKILAKNGLFPSLALTLSSRDNDLKLWIQNQIRLFNLNIVDLGSMSHHEIFELYGCSGALIFPSICESFGLPLLEASSLGIPIIAGELDFVRDVCDPDECFDPKSSISIARAVRRFLNKPDLPLMPEKAHVFLDALQAAIKIE